jgi:hypothetical protein
VYYAWVELYPKFAYMIDGFTVNEGDNISASVTFGGAGKGAFTLTMNNETTGGSFSVTQSSPSAKRLSAEWIVEAPWSGGVLPLANFGTVQFSDCNLTMNGETGAISAGPWLYDAITMETAGGTIEAEPSALSNGGADFSVEWFAE